MEQHFSLNSEDGTVECHTCGKQLASNASLIDHHRTHTGERPYACNVCNKRFTQKAHLIIHKRTHTGEKPYACGICHKRFAQSSHLKNHKRIHTGEKAYLCSICNMGFSRKPRLEQHLEEHILHEALVTKSKKAATEREIKKVSSAIKSEEDGRDSEDTPHGRKGGQNSTHLKFRSGSVSRKRKPAFVTRVRQSDSELSHIEDEDEFDGCGDREDGVAGIHIKTEPIDEQNLFADSVEGSQCPGSLTNSSTCTSESDGHCEEGKPLHSQRDFPIPKTDVGVDLQSPTLKCAEDGSNACDVTSSEQQGCLLLDEGDLASITSESNNSLSDQTVGLLSLPSKSLLLQQRNTTAFQASSNFSRGRAGSRNSSPAVKHSSVSLKQSLSRLDTTGYCRTNSRICLIDFSSEDLITHLMSRDGVLRCDYCCVIFQDPAMYHLHRSMHDKGDIRCCNTCGKQSRDKYDFAAHYLCEHK